MYLISVSKYEVTIYILDCTVYSVQCTHHEFGLVKIMTNQTAVRMLWLVLKLNACLTLLRFFIENSDDIIHVCVLSLTFVY